LKNFVSLLADAKEKLDKDFAANLKKITDNPKLSEAEKSYMINELAAQTANLDPAATQKAWAANRIANDSSLTARQKEEMLKRLDEGKMTQQDMKAIGLITEDSNTTESRNGFWENLGGSILDGVKYLAGQSSSADGYVDENGNWVQATCFVAGTQVKTTSGYRNIEDIRAGDKVLSYNEATKLLAVQTVAQTFIRKADRIYTLLYDNGSRLQTTATHPFYIEGKGWVKAADLHVGDDSLLSREVSQLDVYGGARLQNVSYRQSKQGVIVGIIVEDRAETVYNFEVNETHTYLVGESDVVVHNAGEEYSPLGSGVDVSLLLAKVFYMTPMGMKLKTLIQKDIPRKLDELMFPSGRGLTDKEYQEYRVAREQYRKQWAEDGAAASIMAAGALCAATMLSCNRTNIEKQRDKLLARDDLSKTEALAIIDAFDFYFQGGEHATILANSGESAGKPAMEPVPVGPGRGSVPSVAVQNPAITAPWVLAQGQGPNNPQGPNENNNSGKEPKKVAENGPFPQQGKVTAGVDGAPPVLAGDQGKHIVGHQGAKDPNRTFWPAGENGVKSTQEAFLKPIWKSQDGSIMLGRDSKGRLIRIHVSNSKGGIHGYPLPE